MLKALRSSRSASFCKRCVGHAAPKESIAHHDADDLFIDGNHGHGGSGATDRDGDMHQAWSGTALERSCSGLAIWHVSQGRADVL